MTAATAALVVKIFPSGTPGQVLLEVTQQGPELLSPLEAVRTLRMAAGMMERGDEQPTSEGTHREPPE